MQLNKTNILCTRPLQQLLLDKAADKNIFIDCTSFIETETINENAVVEQIQALAQQHIIAVFTSMNGVSAVTSHLNSKPNWTIFSMGGATKELVYQFFGEAAVKATAKNATALTEKIIAAEHELPIIFFCGDQRLDELPETLREQKIEVKELVVYKTIQTPVLIEQEYNAVVFFSPSAVHSFFSVNTLPVNTILFSIGKTTTATIQSYCSNKVVTSEWPGKEQMIELVMHYFINQNIDV